MYPSIPNSFFYIIGTSLPLNHSPSVWVSLYTKRQPLKRLSEIEMQCQVFDVLRDDICF